MVAREKMIRRLIKQRRLLGEEWRIHTHPKLAQAQIHIPDKQDMHTVLKSTPTSREIATLEWTISFGYRLSILTVGPTDSTDFPGVLPRMAQEVQVYFTGLEVETAFEEVYRTALKMWKAGAKARADHNDFAKA